MEGLVMAHRDEHIIIFEHRDFRGQHRHIFGEEANLNHPEDKTLNDRLSSFVVLSGSWRFFKNANFDNQLGGRSFGPGQYEFVGDFGIPNDAVSSLRAD
jgi:Beta/Gamma crystallin